MPANDPGTANDPISFMRLPKNCEWRGLPETFLDIIYF